MSRPSPYRRIKESLLARIHAGEWRPGDTIPGEETLAVDYGCARATVHRALRELAEAGLLERRPRLGTRIAVPPARVLAFEVPRIDEEVRRAGADYGYRLLSRRLRVPRVAVRERLQLGAGVRAIEVRCLHFANRSPYQYEHRWINLAAVPGARDATFRDQAPGLWLLEHVPWTDVEHVLRAHNADEETAELLEIDAGAALFVVERRTWLGEQVVTWARFLYPGRHFRMRTASRAR